jgi:hypothetical protein
MKSSCCDIIDWVEHSFKTGELLLVFVFGGWFLENKLMSFFT